MAKLFWIMTLISMTAIGIVFLVFNTQSFLDSRLTTTTQTSSDLKVNTFPIIGNHVQHSTLSNVQSIFKLI